MLSYKALYGRKCCSPIHWDEVEERKLLGPELVHQTREFIDKIRRRTKIAQSYQESYASIRRRNLEFNVRDKVFLHVLSMKGIILIKKEN